VNDDNMLARAAEHCARHFPTYGPLGALTAQQILDRLGSMLTQAATDETWRSTPVSLPAGLPLINGQGELQVMPVVSGEQYAAAACFAAAEIELAARRFQDAASRLVALSRTAQVLSDAAAVLDGLRGG
jgi:hypothetical protein